MLNPPEYFMLKCPGCGAQISIFLRSLIGEQECTHTHEWCGYEVRLALSDNPVIAQAVQDYALSILTDEQIDGMMLGTVEMWQHRTPILTSNSGDEITYQLDNRPLGLHAVIQRRGSEWHFLIGAKSSEVSYGSAEIALHALKSFLKQHQTDNHLL